MRPPWNLTRGTGLEPGEAGLARRPESPPQRPPSEIRQPEEPPPREPRGVRPAGGPTSQWEMGTISGRSLGGRVQAGLTATLASGVTHGVIVALVLWQAGPAAIREFSEVLPALYLYAPDRRPDTPREMRLPFEAPDGSRLGSDVPVETTAPGGTVQPERPQRLIGLPPPGRTTMRLDSVFSAIAVDSEVVRFPSAAPIYPNTLLEGGVEGSVEAEFVVDTTGRVDLETVRVLNSSHDDFTSSVQTALAGAMFRPAWRNLRKVRQLVRQRFSFRIYRGPDSVSM